MEEAQAYLLKAGDQAGRIAADAEALAHYQDAIEAYTRAFGDTWDPLERASLERKMGEALFRRGEQRGPQSTCSARLRPWAVRFPLPAGRGAGQSSCSPTTARSPAPLLVPAPDVDAGYRPRARGAVPRVQRSGVDEHVRRHHHLAARSPAAPERGERAGIDWAASAGASGMAMVAHTLSFQWPFRVYISRARTLAEHSGQNPQLAQTELVTGMWAYWVEADFEAALASLRRAAELYRGLGEARLWAMAMGVATYVPSERGELAGGLDTSREMAQLGVETGDRLTEVWGQAWEAELLYLAGEISLGEEAMRRTVDDMLAMMDYRIGGKVAGRLAACYLAQGKLDEAQTLLAEHRELLRKNGIRGGNASSVILNSAAAALVAVERTDGAAPAARLAEARRACRAALKQVKLDRTASVPAYRAQGT